MTGAAPSLDVDARAVLLDLDGVMVVSEASIERAWRAWAEDAGLSWPDVAAHVPGRHAVDTIRAVAPQLSEAEVDAAARAVNDAQVVDTSGLETVAGMRALVDALDGGAWGVVTGCPRRLAAARLAATGYPRPPVLVAAEDVARGKPHPDGYALAAARLGVDAAGCVAIEDAPAGVAAARAAGARVVALTTTHDAADLGDAHAVVPDATWLAVERTARGVAVRVSRA